MTTRILYKFILIPLISIFAFFFCLELFSRLFFYISEKDILAFRKFPGRYKNSYFSGYSLSPNWSLDNNKIKETINSFGFRSPEFQLKKNNNIYRIICIGSSVVYGMGSDEDTFPFRLEEKLNKMNIDGLTFEVINAGIPGYTSYHTTTQFLTSLIDLDPDLIISYQLFNELWYYYERNNGKMNSENFHPITNPKSFKIILDKSYFLTLVNSIKRRHNSKVIDNSNMPNSSSIEIENRIYDYKVLHYYSRNINFLSLACEYLDISLILSVPLSLFKEINSEEEKDLIYDYQNKEFYLEFIEEGNKVLKSISKKHKSVYFFNPSLKIKSNLNSLSDRYHPTVMGNKLISEEYKKFIIENKLFDKK